MASFIDKRAVLLAALLSGCFAVASLAIAARRPFWFDEIVTMMIAQRPTLGDVLEMFRLPWDAQPPANTFLVRTVCTLFGWSELAARLPATIFATAGALVIFTLVRSLTSGLYGLVALSALFTTYLATYAYEVRPYALSFFLATLALQFWITSERVQGARLRCSLLFGASVFVAVCVHYYAVLLLVPFALSEAYKRGILRFLSPRLLYGVAGLVCALGVNWQFIRASSKLSGEAYRPYFGPATIHALQMMYSEALLQFALVVIGALLLTAWLDREVTTPETIAGPNPFERLGWFFLAIPVVGYLLAAVKTHTFWPRYFIAFLAGTALAFGCLLYRRFRTAPLVPLLFLFAGVAVFLATAAGHIANASSSYISQRTPEAEFVNKHLALFRSEGKRLAVLPYGRSYLEARYYSPDARMLCMLRPPPALLFASNPMAVCYFGAEDLAQHGRETAILAPDAELLKTIESLGFRVRWRLTKPVPVIYLE